MTPDTPSSTDVIPSALPPRGSQRGQTRCRSCSSSCRRTSTGPFQHPRICFVTASSAWLWPESSARPEPSWDPTLASDPASRPRTPRSAARPRRSPGPAQPGPQGRPCPRGQPSSCPAPSGPAPAAPAAEFAPVPWLVRSHRELCLQSLVQRAVSPSYAAAGSWPPQSHPAVGR